MRVLAEARPADRPGMLLGTSARYAPVEFAGTDEQIGRIVSLTASRVIDGRIRGVF